MIGVNRFYNSIQNVQSLSGGDLVGLFVYFHTVEMGNPAATVSDIRQCYEDCSLSAPARLAAYLSEGVKAKPQRYLKSAGGYALQRHFREALSVQLGAQTVVAQTSAELRQLESAMAAGAAKDFLSETIDCFEAGANRATITMCWILTMDHMFSHVLNHHLTAFNTAIAAHPDKKMKTVTIRHDMTNMSESRFIELCRTAGVLSNDRRKILDEKLGIRNSAAHPSGIVVKKSKVIEFVDDLVTNIIMPLPR